MTTKLNQLIAIEKGVKSQASSDLSAAAARVAKADLLSGIARTYRPVDDEGEALPPESKRVQVRAREVIADVKATLTRLLDVTATKDVANCSAKADLVVDGVTLAKDLPVTYLLFLEKQLTELKAFVSKLPTLDPAESWSFDPVSDCWATEPTQTVRTRRCPATTCSPRRPRSTRRRCRSTTRMWSWAGGAPPSSPGPCRPRR